MNKPEVGGWLNQLAMLVLGLVALVTGNPSIATTAFVGSIIVGVLRQLERERREYLKDEQRKA